MRRKSKSALMACVRVQEKSGAAAAAGSCNWKLVSSKRKSHPRKVCSFITSPCADCSKVLYLKKLDANKNIL
jgi:hypothetical protein